jgi:hypothetical protein
MLAKARRPTGRQLFPVLAACNVPSRWVDQVRLTASEALGAYVGAVARAGPEEQDR